MLVVSTLNPCGETVSVQVFLEADSRLTKPGVVSLLRKMGAEVKEDDELMDRMTWRFEPGSPDLP